MNSRIKGIVIVATQTAKKLYAVRKLPAIPPFEAIPPGLGTIPKWADSLNHLNLEMPKGFRAPQGAQTLNMPPPSAPPVSQIPLTTGDFQVGVAQSLHVPEPQPRSSVPVNPFSVAAQPTPGHPSVSGPNVNNSYMRPNSRAAQQHNLETSFQAQIGITQTA